MKKSMLNVITLALVLINLVLTVLLTFSLVSTNNRTNNLIKKVGEIIDLDAAGNAANGSQTGSAVNIDDIEYVEVVGVDGGACVALTALGAIKNGYKVIVNEAAIGTMYKKNKNKYFKKLHEAGAEFV